MDFIERLHRQDVEGTPIGDLKLYFCGRRQNAPDHSFGPAARAHFWFIYLQEGSGVYQMNQHNWRISKGMLFAAFPNRRIFYKADPGSVWSIHWVSVDAPFLAEYLAHMNVTEENPIIRLHSPSDAERVFNALLDAIPADTVKSKFDCQSLLYELLSLMTESSLTVYRERDYIEDAVLFMKSNYERPISVSQIASEIGLDRSYFARLFRERFGIPPHEWLLAYRMERALVLLKTDLKISEIALSIGFPDALYFSRRFRQHFGISPAKFRAQKMPEAGDFSCKSPENVVK